jgi:hypothetical protein
MCAPDEVHTGVLFDQIVSLHPAALLDGAPARCLPTRSPVSVFGAVRVIPWRPTHVWVWSNAVRGVR